MATIEIDGKTIEAENGQMIIEVADEHDIYIPRFCYHKKLSVAANCRMCLVEVANSKKTMPACATPVSEGMKVFTKSKAALHSQKTVMDFLLINHPLDCPICDQGGECELQDLSMGFGHDASVYTESKRSVEGDNLGPLIATDMTRCIHCTRCVRFGEEVAGIRELGAVNRGENMEISTFVEHSLVSEVSGNIIDLCPVGALTSKPYRFTARAWEMVQHESIAPHDCLGSNVHVHTRQNKLMRVVPKECEAINETWLSDRDRFSYTGLVNKARVTAPKLKRKGQWHTVSWETALSAVKDRLQHVIDAHGPEQCAALASPSSTLEELYLLQKLMRHLGIENLDHRLQQTDFRDQSQLPSLPTSSLNIADLDNQDAILVIGSHVTAEVPLLGTRLRKVVSNGADLCVINPIDFDDRVPVAAKQIISPKHLPQALAKLVLALAKDVTALPEALQDHLKGLDVDDVTSNLAAHLQKTNTAIITGALCENHPEAAVLRTLVHWIAKLSDTKVLRLTQGANTVGACLAGLLPHRKTFGQSVDAPGLDVSAALDNHLKAYVLLGTEPEFDCANPHRTRQAMLAAECVISLTAYTNEQLDEYADIILPIAPFTETSGTYINVDHTWQSFKGAMQPQGEARPAWKVLRVLGNIFECHDFEYQSSEDVLNEIKSQSQGMMDSTYKPFYPAKWPKVSRGLVRVGEWPLYRTDAIVRHAEPLQACAAAEPACVKVHPDAVKHHESKTKATITQGEIEITLPLSFDERIAKDVVWVPNGVLETIDLGGAFSTITMNASE